MTRVVATADDMMTLGQKVAEFVTAGDLLILDGPLGAGKTTFVRGLGEGLHVRGPITSPTFVVSRIHPSRIGGPALIHVDAYRLGSAAELDDLDLDSDMARSVTVVEWGLGRVETLALEPLLITISRDAEDDQRRVSFAGAQRWTDLISGLH